MRMIRAEYLQYRYLDGRDACIGLAGHRAEANRCRGRLWHSLNSEVEALFKEENADGRGCSLTHVDESDQCANMPA